MDATARHGRAAPLALVVVGAMGFAVSLQLNLLLTVLPRIGDAFDAGSVALSVLHGSGPAVLAVVAPFAGAWADRRGRRPTLLVGVALQALGMGIMAVAPGFAVLVLGRVVTGAGGGFLAGTTLAYIRDLVPADRVGRVLGIVGVVQGIGILLGAPIGANLGEWLGFRPLFASVAMLLLVLLLGALRSLPNTTTRVPGGLLARGGALLAQPRVRRILVAACVQGAAVEAAVVMLPIWMEKDLAFTPHDVGYFFLALGLSMGVSQPIAGIAADRFSRILLLVGAHVGAAVTWLVMASGALSTFGELMAAGVVLGFLGAFGEIAWLSFVTGRVSADARGAVLGLMVTTGLAGTALGSAAAGQAYAANGFAWSAGLAALIFACCAPLVIWTAAAVGEGEGP